MANTFFQFKQFTVRQQLCAMKVSTDACLFGAIVAENLALAELHAGNPRAAYLDIGTGTGLLSLLLAQKTNAFIEAVEIDFHAYLQASNNFADAPFKERLSIYNEDILQFKTTKKYDGIICNPPFHEGGLRSPDAKKNVAKHDTGLTLHELLQLVNMHLANNGVFAVLLPYHRVNECIEAASQLQLYVMEKILLRHSIQHPYFRGILFFQQKFASSIIREVAIKNEDDSYTTDFINLLKDYYLDL